MKSKFNLLLCLVLAIVLSTSCSENAKMKGLLERIPCSSNVVLVGNLKTIVESSGGNIEDSKIMLPKFILNELPDASADFINDANSFLKKSGIDTEVCAFMVKFKEDYPVIVFGLEDKDKFITAIEDDGYKEKESEDGMTFYSKKVYESDDPEFDNYGYIAVDESYAYWIDNVWVGSEFKAIPYIKKIIEESKDDNLANTTYGDYIISGNAGGLAISIPKEVKAEMTERGVPSEFASLYSGIICMRGNLSNNQCSVDIKLFDEEGKEVNADKFANLLNTSATIDKKALALLGRNENIIYAISLKDFNWDNYADLLAGSTGMSRSEKAELNAIFSYLEKIEGTVAWGYGLTNGFGSFENMYEKKNIFDQFSTTLVVETKDGKAKHLIEDLKGFLERKEIPYNDTRSGLSLSLEDIGLSGDIYIKNIDNYIVLANHSISEDNDNVLVNSTDFDSYLSAFCIGFTKSDKMMRDLGIKDDVKIGFYCKPETMEISLSLEIEGDNDKGIMAKAAKIIINIMDKVKDYERNFNNSYEQDDEIVVDTFAIEEPEYVDSIAY